MASTKGNAPRSDREPGTRPDGEALQPDAIDPEPDGKGEGIPPLPAPDVEGVGKEGLDRGEEPPFAGGNA